MKAIVCDAFGPPESLRVETRPEPEPRAGEVCIEARAMGLNFVDVLMVAGAYQHRPELPFVPGLEGAGVVARVGADVVGVEPGARVIFGMRPGTFATTVCVKAASTLPMPDTMTFEQGACFRSAFATAYHGLKQGGRLAAGEVALIHGATGGMGLAAVQLAKLMGATVIATGGRDDKLEIVKRYGADHVINYSTGRFREQVRDLAGGADLVFDPVGGDIFDESMRCLNWGARLVVVGFAGGRPALAKTNHVLIKGASVVGIRAGEFGRRNPEAAAENMQTLLGWAAEARISSHISHRFPLSRVVEGMQALKNREVVGRAVLLPD